MNDISLSLPRSMKILLTGLLVLVTTAEHPAFAATVKMVVLGDSLSAGYHLPQGSSFPDQLQWRLNKDGHQVQIANAGVSGDTTAAGLARLDWAVPEGTQAVIVELGANDALRGVDPGQTFKNLDRLIARLKKRKIAVLLAGMEAPRNMGDQYVRAFRKIYTDLARKYKIALYPFFLKGVALKPALLLDDGLHPNERGVTVMVKNILPYVERLLASLR